MAQPYAGSTNIAWADQQDEILPPFSDKRISENRSGEFGVVMSRLRIPFSENRKAVCRDDVINSEATKKKTGIRCIYPLITTSVFKFLQIPAICAP